VNSPRSATASRYVTDVGSAFRRTYNPALLQP
jgi:hypothetical protein